LKAGDLLISRANTRELVGSAAVVQEEEPFLLLCDKLYRLRLDQSKVFPEFMAHYLSTPEARGQIELDATGASASMLNIGQATILELPVPIPSIKEQKHIVRLLSDSCRKLDLLIEQSELAIKLLKERRSALISAAVSGKIDVRNAP
jgi:type I restriction enzyme S subunit